MFSKDLFSPHSLKITLTAFFVMGLYLLFLLNKADKGTKKAARTISYGF